MWHASSGDKTFTGPYGLMLAQGICRVIDEMNELHGCDEEFEIGIRAFDSQTREQKAWSLHKVAFRLLDDATPIVELSAYLEATIAAVFGMVDACIQMELDEGDFFWRKLVLAAFESIGGNRPEDLEGDEELLTAECDAIDQWRLVLGTLEEQVFWDMDYTNDRMIDMSPEQGAEMRGMFGVADDYYTAVPDDPRREESKKLLKETATLCGRVSSIGKSGSPSEIP